MKVARIRYAKMVIVVSVTKFPPKVFRVFDPFISIKIGASKKPSDPFFKQIPNLLPEIT